MGISVHVANDLRRWLLPWAAEFGWELVDENPPVFTRAGRTLQLKYNKGGKLSGITWVGGPEHSDTTPAGSSLNKVRLWMATPLDEPADDSVV